MKPGCILIRAQQRLVRSRVYRHIDPTEFDCIERVASGLLDRNVPGNGRDGSNAYIRRAQGHDDGNGIIGRRIGINKECPRHSRKDSKEDASSQ
jgi:hypothetical protein